MNKDAAQTVREALAGIRERVDFAAHSPWQHETQPYDQGPDVILDAHGEEIATTQGGGGADWSNANFIAHTRTDIPRLLAMLDVALAALEVVLTGDPNGGFYAAGDALDSMAAIARGEVE